MCSWPPAVMADNVDEGSVCARSVRPLVCIVGAGPDFCKFASLQPRRAKAQSWTVSEMSPFKYPLVRMVSPAGCFITCHGLCGWQGGCVS